MSSVPPPREESDSDDDDYVPPVDDSSSDVEPAPKRARTTSPQLTADEAAAKKKERDDLWASFQASVAAPPASAAEPPKPTIKVEKRYRFAGEEISEVVEVPADSLDAKEWPEWRLPQDPESSAAPQPSLSLMSEGDATPSSSSTGSAPKPPLKKPGPRKPRTSLPALPTSSSHKAKRLTTLDKSAMDWRSHVNAEQGSGLKDELEANRRGGGYLEKVEFLTRVDQRKDEALEASKAKRKRAS